jgi:hypothetical protein
MSRPDPIQYAERLYTAIRAANFSPISFLAFGNAVKDGVDFRRMPRMAAEPFMRVVGEMLDLEEDSDRSEAIDATPTESTPATEAPPSRALHQQPMPAITEPTADNGVAPSEVPVDPLGSAGRRRSGGRR